MVISMKLKSTGLKHTALANGPGKSKGPWRKENKKFPYLAICVCNDGNEISLQKGKAYRIIKPLANDPAQRLRVIDEENEDYLYPADWFVPIQVPLAARKNVWRAVSVA